MNKKLISFGKRLATIAFVVWTVVSLVTLLMELVPGDPAKAILGDNFTEEQYNSFKRKHGLDKPAFFFSISQSNGVTWHGLDNRYANYWKGVLSFDLGRSFRTDRPVVDMILERYPNTLFLALSAMLVSIMIALPLGVLSGSRKGSFIDSFSSVFALIGISLPGFVIGPVLVYLFAVKFKIFRPTGSANIEDVVLPAIALGAALSAILTRMVRSSVIEEMREDYVRTARAKGLSELKVILKHVLKNGLIPVVTVLGLQLGVLLAGAIITEKIFSWQGLGLLLVEDGINKLDYRVVQGCVLVISLTYILANNLTDFVYKKLDPRIRLS